ncbi:DegT/DnrJ/EryC1/StrS family aminotransferase [Nocardia sp. NBC_01329]|uniref:DegT/DnrJ/EryC1/StrS family aminotransferase n=1 Tax=Nocardia sp. NBC_01329 TaxID=2903594 RepID=UPI002E142448|nr:DegT/DnrJ/EryC1/StrS family aminotransferase [Nocardia sp. NBC_01329]
MRSAPYRWPVHDEAERRELLEVLDSDHWSFDGPQETALGGAMADYLGAEHALPVANGTAALEIALEALDLGPGDEVIVPGLAWTAVAHAVVVNGGVPVFADIDPRTWCMDPAAVEEAVTERTRGILVVHTYAHIADMERLLDIARRHELFVVEDGGHVFGARWNNRSAGTLGRIGCFSFQQSKAPTAGEGGLVVTSDPRLADRVYSLANCGRRRRPEADWGFGGNHRITEFQAAILRAQLRRVDDQIVVKSRQVAAFRAGLAATSGLILHQPDPRITRRNFAALPLTVDIEKFGGVGTELIVTALAAEGIPAFLPHQVVYRAPTWVAGLRRYPRHRLGLDARCPAGEQVAGAAGIVIAQEAFLGRWTETAHLLDALDKVRRLATTIPAGARDTRRI